MINRRGVQDPIDQRDLLQSIFKFVPFFEVCKNARVCRSWNYASKLQSHPDTLRVYASRDEFQIKSISLFTWPQAPSSKVVDFKTIHPSRLELLCSQVRLFIYGGYFLHFTPSCRFPNLCDLAFEADIEKEENNETILFHLKLVTKVTFANQFEFLGDVWKQTFDNVSHLGLDTIDDPAYFVNIPQVFPKVSCLHFDGTDFSNPYSQNQIQIMIIDVGDLTRLSNRNFQGVEDLTLHMVWVRFEYTDEATWFHHLKEDLQNVKSLKKLVLIYKHELKDESLTYLQSALRGVQVIVKSGDYDS